MSFAYSILGKYVDSLNAAQQSLKHYITALGFYRLGCAFYCMKYYTEALEAFNNGLIVEPTAKEISSAIKIVISRIQCRKDR